MLYWLHSFAYYLYACNIMTCGTIIDKHTCIFIVDTINYVVAFRVLPLK